MPGKPIRLLPNEPQTVKLLDPYADSCERYDAERAVGEYRTTDNRILALPRPAVLKLNELDPAPGEEIGICRYDKQHGKGSEWAVWLTASSEKQRAIEAGEGQDAPEVPSDEELLLEASLKRQQARKAQTNGNVKPIRKPSKRQTDDQPRLFDRATGTYGPAPAPVPLPAVARRLPYKDVLRQIVRTVKTVLVEENVHLGDGPTERLVVTLFIDAAKHVKIDYDFTESV